jgi:hypothetical protein
MKTINSRVRTSNGLTLIEVLIATTLTLLMMLALAQGFKALSDGVSEGRSKIHLSDQLRGISLLLNQDLQQRTTDGTTPQLSSAPNGYFKYYDGLMSDYTAAEYNRPSTFATDAEMLTATRWGDLDDMLMFTAKARRGESFKGKVPRALLRIHELNTNPTAVAPSDWNEEWSTDVVISSDLAEIVWFMVPLENVVLSGVDTGVMAPSNVGYDVVAIVDRTNDSIPDGDGIPDKMALCRRVLLIRPDLNIAPNIASAPLVNATLPGLPMASEQGSLFGLMSNPANRLFYMQPVPPSIGGYRNICENAYRRCDLSITTELITTPSGGTMLAYRTNSLTSLQDPQHRFAHAFHSLPTGEGTTLASLVLSNNLPLISKNFGDVYTLSGSNYSVPSPSQSVTLPDAGFVPSNFFRVRYLKNRDGSIKPNPQATSQPYLDFTLEEIVGTNITAFDLKGYDQTAPILYDASIDVVVGPSDPGFWRLLETGTAPTEAARGGYVDAGWAFHKYEAPTEYASANADQRPTLADIASNTNTRPFLVSDLSGVAIQNNGSAEVLAVSSFLLRSGNFCVAPGVLICQPAFDTFTDIYDIDGELCSFIGSPATFPTTKIYPEGLRRYGIAPTPNTPFSPPDPLYDSDVPPPFPVNLTSIQVTLRVEDVPAGTIQQISLIHSLD